MKNLYPRQLPTRSRVTAMAALAGLWLAITGCHQSTRVTTHAAGHEIQAVIAGAHAITSQPDHGTISSPSGKITIEPTRVKLGNAPWTTIPEAVPVEVRMSKGKLWLHAGRVTIKQTVR